MATKKEEKAAEETKKTETNLDPCETPHSMEASRPDKEEEACDEGVK